MQYRTNCPYATTSQHSDAQFNSRDEQRRRQLEYFQALSQQVAQREQQKCLVRDHDVMKRNDVVPHLQETFESAARGIFDGLGQNNPQKARNNFLRGQRQPHERLYTEKSYPPHAIPSDNGPLPPCIDYQSEVSGPFIHQQHLQPEQNWPESIRSDSMSGAVGSNLQAIAQNPLMAQPRIDQIWAEPSILKISTGYLGFESLPQKAQAEYFKAERSGYSHAPAACRRATFRNGGQGDAEETERFQRKVKQQHEMQLALGRQIEDKRQQKLKAKQKQEEEDRLELKRFEEDLQRLRVEQDRLEDDKRRKAKLEQEKADHAAAAVTEASLQAKLQQQLQLHAQFGHVQQEHDQLSPPTEQIKPLSKLLSPERLKNLHTNSHSHLCEAPRSQESALNSCDINHQNAAPGHESGGRNDTLSPAELCRQYDDMREDLRRQKQLVNQLCQAQVAMQQQQQQQSSRRVKSEIVPTLEDLEILCNELHDELTNHKHLHRQEMDSLKRKQQLVQQPVCEIPGTNLSYELPAFTKMVPDENAMSLRGDSTFVYFKTEEEKADQDDRRRLDGETERVQVQTILPQSNHCLGKLYHSKMEIRRSDDTRREEREATDANSEGDAVEFSVTSTGSFPSYQSPNYSSSAGCRKASSHRYSQLPSAVSISSHTKELDKWRPKPIGTHNASDSDDDLEETLDGDQLDALFQSEVRRHKIFKVK